MLGSLRKFCPASRDERGDRSVVAVSHPRNGLAQQGEGVYPLGRGVNRNDADALGDPAKRAPLSSSEPLAGVRTRAELDEEIASENRAISRIEQAIDEYIPPTCEFCTVPAFDECSLCERPMCEDDSVVEGVCIECDAEVLS
jgi:hypothetical protein